MKKIKSINQNCKYRNTKCNNKNNKKYTNLFSNETFKKTL